MYSIHVLLLQPLLNAHLDWQWIHKKLGNHDQREKRHYRLFLSSHFLSQVFYLMVHLFHVPASQHLECLKEVSNIPQSHLEPGSFNESMKKSNMSNDIVHVRIFYMAWN